MTIRPGHITDRYDEHGVYRDLVFVQTTLAVDSSLQDFPDLSSLFPPIFEDNVDNNELTTRVPHITASAHPDFAQLRAPVVPAGRDGHDR